MNENGAQRGEIFCQGSQLLLQGARIDSGLFLLALSPQELRHQGVDSSLPMAFLPGVSHSSANRRPRSPPPHDPDPGSILLKEKGGAGPLAHPAPPGHQAPGRAGERTVRAPTTSERAAAISRPTSISPVPTRANYHVNHRARGSRGKKESQPGRGRARLAQSCWPQTG